MNLIVLKLNKFYQKHNVCFWKGQKIK